ncbi:hypothetical protein GCM10025734_31470 [Kitasatospora paranensis]
MGAVLGEALEREAGPVGAGALRHPVGRSRAVRERPAGIGAPGPSLAANRSDDEPRKPYRHYAEVPAVRAESVLAQLLDALEREPFGVEFVAVQDSRVCAYWREMIC